MVRLHTADRDERVAALGERLGREVLELPHLVATVGKSGVAVLPLRPELDLTAEVVAQPVEPVDRGGAEEQRDTREVGERHRGSVEPATPYYGSRASFVLHQHNVDNLTPLL